MSIGLVILVQRLDPAPNDDVYPISKCRVLYCAGRTSNNLISVMSHGRIDCKSVVVSANTTIVPGFGPKSCSHFLALPDFVLNET
jgi:hypothetical protein